MHGDPYEIDDYIGNIILEDILQANPGLVRGCDMSSPVGVVNELGEDITSLISQSSFEAFRETGTATTIEAVSRKISIHRRPEDFIIPNNNDYKFIHYYQTRKRINLFKLGDTEPSYDQTTFTKIDHVLTPEEIDNRNAYIIRYALS